MKKRFLPVLLALALCLGLCAPSFAADKKVPPLPTVTLDLPEGCTAREETAEYRLRPFTVEAKAPREDYIMGYETYDLYTYSGETVTETFDVTTLPAGASVRIDGSHPGVGGWFSLELKAWSDPDGDGVYNERLFSWEPVPPYGHNSYSIVPLGDGPYDESSISTGYGFRTTVEAEYSVFETDLTADPDGLAEYFGPNTLIQITTQYFGEDGDSTEPETLACFLIAGKDADEDGAAAEVTVAGPGGAIAAEEKDFVLRDVTVKMGLEMSPTYAHDILTRYAAEERQESLDEVYVMTSASSVTISGLRTGDGSNSPLDAVSVRAWSDPDGDGVYDQQVFTSRHGGSSAVVVPFSMPGPFRANWGMYDVYPWYDISADLRGDDFLYTGARNLDHPYSHGNADLLPSLTLSAGFLTEQFGPNTLIQLEVYTLHFHKTNEDELLDGQYITLYLPETSFTDVPEWCAPAVDWAIETGITMGVGGNMFDPGTVCTNAQILTFLWRAADEPEPVASSPFTVASYYQDAVDWAYEEGMIGEDFVPSAHCTRASAVKFIWQALDEPDAGDGSFVDVPVGADYAPAASWAVTNGIAQGYGNNDFRPGNTCTRGEIVTMLHRAFVPDVRLTVD